MMPFGAKNFLKQKKHGIVPLLRPPWLPVGGPVRLTRVRHPPPTVSGPAGRRCARASAGAARRLPGDLDAEVRRFLTGFSEETDRGTRRLTFDREILTPAPNREGAGVCTATRF